MSALAHVARRGAQGAPFGSNNAGSNQRKVLPGLPLPVLLGTALMCFTNFIVRPLARSLLGILDVGTTCTDWLLELTASVLLCCLVTTSGAAIGWCMVTHDMGYLNTSRPDVLQQLY